jgi:hypothetical protein
MRAATSRKSLQESRAHPRAVLAGVFAALLAVGTASAGTFVYGCVLSDKQETAPTGSPAFGGGQFLIDTNANTVTYRIAFFGLVAGETAAHIHGPADPGVNAGVLDGLALGNPKVGVWNYLEAQEGDILAGKTYVNIHSIAFPGGEVRGQITAMNASLDGGQEVPSNGSTGSGWGVFRIDTATNQLTYYIAVGGLAGVETAAHIHGMALHGSNAGVVQALPLGSPKVGVWNYAEAQEEGILTGHCYVNVHTTMFPGGEIRGQVVPVVIPIDGQQEVPANASPGAGVGLISFDTATDDLSYDFRFAGLAGAETAAHIHGFAPPGSNGGVLQPLPLGNRVLGLWNFGAANETQVLGGLTYVNMHSTVAPGGEIRGQIRGFPTVGASSVAEGDVPVALQFARMSPNPLHGQGTIQFRLDQAAPVRIAFYDLQGRLVRDLGERTLGAGDQAVAWDGRDGSGRLVASGYYQYVLETPQGQVSRHVTVLR